MLRKGRTLLTGLFLALLSAAIFGVFGQWFIQVATDKGWYRNAGTNWDRGVSAVLAVLSSAYIWVAVAGTGGLAAGLWFNVRSKRPDGIGRESLDQLRLRYPHPYLTDRLKSLRRETDYTKKFYKGVIVDIGKLPDDSSNTKTDLTFEECLLVGPAVVAWGTKGLASECNFLNEHNEEELFLEISPERGIHLFAGGYLFERCTFVHCTFYKVVFIGLRENLQRLRSKVVDQGYS